MSATDETAGTSPADVLRIDGSEAEVLEVRVPAPAPGERPGGEWHCPGCSHPQDGAPALYLLVRRRRHHLLEQWIRLCDDCCQSQAVQRVDGGGAPRRPVLDLGPEVVDRTREL